MKKPPKTNMEQIKEKEISQADYLRLDDQGDYISFTIYIIYNIAYTI